MPLYLDGRKSKDVVLNGRSIRDAYLNGVLVYTKRRYRQGQVIFESATPGTYTLNFLETGTYEIYCIGGGGGGVYGIIRSGEHNGYSVSAAGGSGGGFIGRFSLSANSRTLVVGNRGTLKNGGNVGAWVYGNVGTASSISGVVSCGGASRSGIDKGSPYSDGGNGGTVSLYITPTSTILNSSGNNGGRGNPTRSTPNYSGGASLYGSHGKGGDSRIDNSTTGYIKIVYIGD